MGGEQMFSSDLLQIWIVSQHSMSWWLRSSCRLDFRERELCQHLANGDNGLGEDKVRKDKKCFENTLGAKIVIIVLKQVNSKPRKLS